MSKVLGQVVAWFNVVANALGKLVLGPIGLLPGWLSATLVSALTGVLLLVIFKYTSNQRAIKRVRDDINAHLLSLKLFKESASVALRAQGRILIGAFRLLILALVPTLVMAVPVCLLLSQLGLWYQARPLGVGEEALLSLKLNGDRESPWPDVRLVPNDAFETTLGPVRVLSQRALFWNIKAKDNGYHRLVFQVNDQAFEKELAIGKGFMRVSEQRPSLVLKDVLLHPWEPPLGSNSSIHSIAIDYPHRASWISGTDSWVIYWFIVSMVAALCFRRLLKVNV